MKFIVSLILLYCVTAADPRVVKGNDNLKSSPMKQKLARLSPFHETRNVDIGTRAENCVQDYSPCDCVSYPEIRVLCTSVSVATVRDVFQRVNDAEIASLYLTQLFLNDTNVVSLPADLLGDTSVTGEIIIQYATYLVIDPLTFRASQNSLTKFEFNYIHSFSQRDFNFLNGFNKLERLDILLSNNISAFQYLPPLPSLRNLQLRKCTGLITFPDLSSAKLEVLWVESNSINDGMADEIVASLVANSTDSLTFFDLWDNSLTRIPNQLGSPFAFPNLDWMDLGFNDIKTIENGTFQGTTSSLRDVGLSSNELVAFEEGVFKELLEQMVTAAGGKLVVDYNPFACGCDMAWLIRDNQNLLPRVSGMCGENSPFPGVYFKDLKPESFANCSIIDDTPEKATTPVSSASNDN